MKEELFNELVEKAYGKAGRFYATRKSHHVYL